MLSNNKYSQNMQIAALCFIATGLFITPYFFREQFVVSVLHSEKTYLWAINILATIGMIFLYLFAEVDVKKKLSALLLFGLPAVSFVPAAISLYNYGNGLGVVFVSILIIFIPVYFIYVKLSDEIIEKWAPWFILGINILLFILAIHGSIDMMFDKAINKWLASFLTHCHYVAAYAKGNAEDTRRFMSLYGTQLHTAYIANTLFTMNVIAQEKKIRFSIPILIAAVPTVIVLCCTASKAAIFTFCIIIFLAVLHSLKLVIATLIGGVIFYFLGAFNLIIERVTTISLTNGRIKSLTKFFNNSEYQLKFLTGYGSPEYGDTFKHFPQSFEFPPFMGAFNYGCLFVLLFFGVPVIYIFVKLARRGCIKYLLMILILFANTNTYSQLIQGDDHPYFTWFSIMILINLSLYKVSPKVDKAQK